jgi:hypothetical protein
MNWKKHYMSKAEYPTLVNPGSGSSRGSTTVGHKTAERALVSKLGRPLREGWKVVTKGGNWCFMEPKGPS